MLFSGRNVKIDLLRRVYLRTSHCVTYKSCDNFVAAHLSFDLSPEVDRPDSRDDLRQSRSNSDSKGQCSTSSSHVTRHHTRYLHIPSPPHAFGAIVKPKSPTALLESPSTTTTVNEQDFSREKVLEELSNMNTFTARYRKVGRLLTDLSSRKLQPNVAESEKSQKCAVSSLQVDSEEFHFGKGSCGGRLLSDDMHETSFAKLDSYNHYVQSYTYTADDTIHQPQINKSQETGEDICMSTSFLDTIYDFNTHLQLEGKSHTQNYELPKKIKKHDNSNNMNIFSDIFCDNQEYTFTNKSTPLNATVTTAQPFLEPHATVQCSASPDLERLSCAHFSTEPSNSAKEEPKSKKPNLDQLMLAQEELVESLENVFVKTHNYSLYRQDLLFENNFFEKSYTTRGIGLYAFEIAKFRFGTHFKYANVRLEIVRSTVEEKDGTVLIRWRVKGLPQARAFMFWKFLPWKYSKSQNVEAEWVDGLSTFYVDSDRLTYKHKVDRVIPDENTEPVEPAEAVKLAPLP